MKFEVDETAGDSHDDAIAWGICSLGNWNETIGAILSRPNLRQSDV